MDIDMKWRETTMIFITLVHFLLLIISNLIIDNY